MISKNSLNVMDLHKRTKMDNVDKCQFCATGLIFERNDVDEFQYGADANAVMLSAPVVVLYCDTCDEQWTDFRSEETRQEAVEAHLATKGIYLCTICRAVPVDADEGFDTCDNCVGAF